METERLRLIVVTPRNPPEALLAVLGSTCVQERGALNRCTIDIKIKNMTVSLLNLHFAIKETRLVSLNSRSF